MNETKYDQILKDLRRNFFAGGIQADYVNKLVALRGENDILWIYDGHKTKPVIDANSGCFGPISIGYSNPYFLKILHKQTEKLIHSLFVSDTVIECSKKIASISPKGLDRILVATCASHAIEATMRLCWEATGKWGIIAIKEGYHGMELGVAGITSRKVFRKTNYPVSPEGATLMPNCYCYRCPFGLEYPSCNYRCAYALEDVIQYGSPYLPAALIIEPIQQATFSSPPSNEYFQILGKICKKYDMYLIVDETQYGGVGRLGKEWFATQLFGIPADIIITGKGIGNGVPIGVAIMKDEILDRAWTGIYGNEGKSRLILWTTHMFDPLVAGAALAVIEYIKKENLLDRTEKVGRYIIGHLLQIQRKSKIIGRVDGYGLYIGIELVKDKETKEPFVEAIGKFESFALKRGVFFPPARGTSIIGIRPPLTIEKKNVDKIINVVADGIREVEKTILKN